MFSLLRISGLLAIIGIAACDSPTGPDDSLVGQYEMSSIDGDTALSKTKPDGSVQFTFGFVILRKDGSYSYAVFTRSCLVYDCETMKVKVFGGTWTGRNSEILLNENADGTVRHWQHSDGGLSGREPKFFNGPADLVFRYCGSFEAGNCALYPGT